ncbi:kinase-like domain-containing protein [Haematococcus lacustris]
MYMSPELVVGHAYNEKVDVFSFAIIMYELFMGRLLAFRGEFMTGDESVVEEYVQARAKGAREKLPSRWPAPLASLVADCWAQDPQARPGFAVIQQRLREMAAAGLFRDGSSSKDVGKKRAAGQASGGAGGGCCALM